MKITKINLHNIGPYKGDKNILNLNVENDKNIILIGGKNGAGKTTLLNSIKIGLFGTYAFGLKTNSSIYFNALKKLFNYVEAQKNISNYSIEIEFLLTENYIENKYIFIRSWRKIEDNIMEDLKIKRNSNYLDDEDCEQIQTKLKEIMPPAVIDTMLFDGEKIAQIIDDNNISQYLKEIINVNFNLNIFDKMEDDINFYITKEKERKSFSAEEINLLEYRNKYNENLKNQKNINDIYEKYLKRKEEEQFKLKNLLKKFENYGGLTDKDKFAMRSSLELLEKNRKENMATIKNFLEDDIVFYLNYQRILNIKDGILQEKPKILLQYVKAIEEYLGENSVEDIKKELISRVNNDEETIKYNATSKLVSLINNFVERYKTLPVESLKQLLISSRDDLYNTKIYKQIINKNENDNSKDLQLLLKEIKTLEISLEEISIKIKELEKDIKRINVEVSNSLIELETIEKKLDTDKKEENSFYIARKILKVSEDYKNKQISNYLNKIAVLSVKKFSEINKKENYVTKIEINKENYDISLFDANGIQKDITILSAGEKQLLISAIVWAIFKLSDRNNIFTFDTPLARLDKQNRALFVERILCTISDQVLILSTDEEIVGDLYEIVKPHISVKYILENNDKIGKTTIKEEYF